MDISGEIADFKKRFSDPRLLKHVGKFVGGVCCFSKNGFDIHCHLDQDFICKKIHIGHKEDVAYFTLPK